MDLPELALRIGLGLGVIVAIMTVCLYAVLAERKVSAWIQGRVGPNRTAIPWIAAIPVIGPFLQRLGIFQPLADGGKFLFKEDIIPAHVNKVYFVLAPIIAFVPALVTISVVPFGQYVDAATQTTKTLILANVDVALLFIFAFGSLGVYAIVLSGWASNSKYPFLGGIRASAQLISYELAMGLSTVGVLLIAGSLSLVEIVQAQSRVWFIVYQPLAFVIFMITALAETNRAPFDLPEAEAELVAGFHTEYSSMKFGLFFLGEFMNVIAISCIAVTLFLGGWNGPGPAFLGIVWFLLKLCVLLFLFIWMRTTLPRLRYDQLMRFGWKALLPVATVNAVVTAVLVVWI